MTRPTIDPVSGDPIPAVSDGDPCDLELLDAMADETRPVCRWPSRNRCLQCRRRRVRYEMPFVGGICMDCRADFLDLIDP